MLWGRAKFRLGRAGNLNSLASTGQRLWSSKFWFVFLCWVACLWLFSDKHERDTCVREAMHGVGASVKFSCATLDILLVLSYARNPKWRERWNLLSSLTALPVQWLITNEAIKWLLTKCLSARLSNVSKFQCAVSASQICTTASAGCIPPPPLHFILIPFGMSHMSATHLSLVFL